MDAAADPPTDQPDPKPSRSGRLLAVVRKLIDYGKELATTIRQRISTEPTFATSCFGTTDLAKILACIVRGLHRANALEARVIQRAAVLDAGPRPRRPRSEPKPQAAPRPADRQDAPLTQLPTAEQIAAEVRRRPIGAVIADICRDLGILPSHPLWREVQEAMFEFGGNLSRLVCDLMDRALFPGLRRWQDGVAAALRGPVLDDEAPAGTGPP
jgi:hypothetical protein